MQLDGFKILTRDDLSESLLEYREKGALRGVYLGFPVLHEYYTMSLPGVTDWTGYAQSGKTEVLLELLLNTSIYYGWKHLLYVPDVGTKNEIVAILIHKLTGKTFDKRYKNSNLITQEEVVKELDWVLQHFFILHKIDKKSKITPYQFWDLAVEMKSTHGIKTATIDSWKDLKHGKDANGENFSRDDKYLEDVLSYRNMMAEENSMHFHTIIHPRNGIEKDKNGNRVAPKPDDLKGGSEWWNNGKVMITIHRTQGHKNEFTFIVTKAKPQSVAKQGECKMYLDIRKRTMYWEYQGEKIYAKKDYVLPNGLSLDNEEDDNDVPF